MISLGVMYIVMVIGWQVLTLISVMRLIALKTPLVFFDGRKILAILSFIIIIAGIIGFTSFYSSYTGEFEIFKWNILMQCSCLTVCILVGFISNLISKKKIKKSKEFAKGETDISNKSLHQQRGNHMQAIKRLLMLSIVNSVCYLPYSIAMFYYAFNIIMKKPMDFSFILLFLHITAQPILICPGLNSLVYILWSKDIRTYYKRAAVKIFYRIRKEGSQTKEVQTLELNARSH